VKGSKGIQNTLLLFHYLSALSIKFSRLANAGKLDPVEISEQTTPTQLQPCWNHIKKICLALKTGHVSKAHEKNRLSAC
jgi:hypothetical protein